jgi:hypothetical protein
MDLVKSFMFVSFVRVFLKTRETKPGGKAGRSHAQHGLLVRAGH